MALLVSYSDPKLRKQFMLKDYLLDDLSSCSSSGFRSFPRRQCCTTSVRFLLEIDLTKKNKTHHQQLTGRRSKSAAPSPAKSALQKASEAVINAVKHLPFAAAVKPTKAILPRSFSRKLFKRSFWKKSDRKEIEQWKSFHTVVEEKSDFSLSKTTSVTAAVTNCISTTKCSSCESSGKSKKSYSSNWSDSEFTRSSSSCSSGNSETVNSCDKVLPDDEVGKRVAVVGGEDSTDATTTPTANCIIASPKKQWANEEAKEQFSPVSVLDCPFDNDDGEAEEEVSSPFKRRVARAEGTKHMQKLRRFESLTQLEPVDLEKRIALSDFDHESVGSPLQPCLLPIWENNISNEEEEDNKAATKAVELLEQMKAKPPSVTFKFKAENLLSDFFREGIIQENAYDCELLDVAKDWINGQTQELFVGWEVQMNRQAYIKDMEKGGMWGKLDEEKEEVALELEAEIFTSLVNVLFLDLFNLAM